MEFDEYGAFSRLAVELVGFRNGAKSAGLLVRRISPQTSCQFIACAFSLICVHCFLYMWRFIDPRPLYVLGQKGRRRS